jgi:diacylglycerol O-acyltransferase
VTLAFRDLLQIRGENPSEHAVRTLVPVSVRRPDQHGHLDNQVSAILLDLPVDETDPEAVLEVVARRMAQLKASHEAETGQLITTLGNVIPPAGLAAGLKLAFRVPQRVLTTVTTNVPGPREELHLAGRRMLAAYPYVPIADRLRTGIAVTSYAGKLLFGITADWRSTPDIDVLRDGLVTAFEELSRQPTPR